MARQVTEGWEMGDNIGVTASSRISMDSTYKRSGSYGLRVGDASAGYTAYARIAVPTPGPELYIRYGFYTGAWASASKFRVLDIAGADLIYIIQDASTGVLKLYINSVNVATGSMVLSASTWYLIEVYVLISDSSGVVTVKIEGVQDFTYPGDTKPGSNTNIYHIQWEAITTNAGTQFQTVDDIAINDISTGSDNSWCGDGKIIKVLPTGTTTNQLNGSDGNKTDNHLLVDEIPTNSDTDYVEGSVVDERDVYTVAGTGLTNADVIINRIWVESRSRDTNAAGGLIALISQASGGSEVATPDVSLLTTYTMRVKSAEQLVNPVDSAAWEVADLDALSIGAKTRSA